MSNSASLSAAKRRRGGAPPPMGPPPGQPPAFPGSNMLPPGLPQNFRQLPPQIQQQMIRQMQQKMGASVPGVQPTPGIAPSPVSTRSEAVSEPYVVNSVVHNHAMSQLNGVSLRDLPVGASGLPYLPSGGSIPPNVLFKLHHDELLHKDIVLTELSNKLHMLTTRVDKIDKQGNISSVSNAVHVDSTNTSGLVDNSDFISKIVDNILTNTNLSDIINQIEPLQKENESLRLLINSQQKTLNELSALVMNLINKGLPSYVDTNFNTIADTTENVSNVQYVYNPHLDLTTNTTAHETYNAQPVEGEYNDNECCGEYAEEDEQHEEGVTLDVKTATK